MCDCGKYETYGHQCPPNPVLLGAKGSIETKSLIGLTAGDDKYASFRRDSELIWRQRCGSDRLIWGGPVCPPAWTGARLLGCVCVSDTNLGVRLASSCDWYDGILIV